MDLGIRDMSSVHAAAAAGCELPSDIIGNILREDDLIVEPIAFEDGALVVPDAPGLGIELDGDALEKYRVPLEPAELESVTGRWRDTSGQVTRSFPAAKLSGQFARPSRR